MEQVHVVPMTDRKYMDVPIDRIKVLNSRSREMKQFKENVRSIKDVGMLKAIMVNERFFEKTGFYELVCGQGRYLACKELGRNTIWAEVVNCSKEQAYLISLVENIARVTPDTMWFANEIKRLHDTGWNYEQISAIVNRPAHHVSDFIRLVENGEERLIKGVEQGLFPMSFATLVARSTDADIQNVLMDGYDSGILHTTNVTTIRKMLELRNQSKARSDTTDPKPYHRYTIQELNDDINRITREKEAYVKETSFKENRLLTLIDVANSLFHDGEMAMLIKGENLDDRPTLTGKYNIS